MYLAAHLVEGDFKDAPDGVDVCEVAENVLGGGDGGEGVGGGGGVTDDKADAGAGLCEGDGTCLADAAGRTGDEDIPSGEGEEEWGR